MGATWPVVNKAYIRHIEKVGKGTGTLYSVNSVGAIIGAWTAGFILIPWLGIKGSSMFAASLNLIIGVIIFRVSKKQGEKQEEKKEIEIIKEETEPIENSREENP